MRLPIPARRYLLLLAALGIGALLAAPTSATFQGRNGRITFVRFLEGKNGAEIFSARPNGRDVKRLTNAGRNHTSFLSDWSPDGRRIAFDSDRVDTDRRRNVVQIYVMNADGSAERQLTRGPGFHGAPGWSPDGDSIAIEAHWGRRPLQGIWIIPATDPNGVRRQEARRLTNGPPAPGFDSEPQFCAGGKTIVFTRYKDIRHSAIYRVRVGGGGLERLTPFSLNASDPDCSPSGRKITFDSGDAGLRGSRANIYVMRLNGSRLTRLTDLAAVQEGRDNKLANNPVWSPSGAEIIYTLFREGGTRLIRMNADGSGKHAILSRSGFPNKVDWGSRP